MLRIQVLLLAALLAAGEVGEAGLAELAAARAAIRLVAGEGTRTVVRADEPDEPGEARRVRFAVAADGRYDIVLTDPQDPQGERTRFVCDGRTVSELSQMSPDDPPLRKRRAADADLTARLLACLRLDLAALRKDYAVELIAVEGGRELRLVPTEPALAKEVARVALRLDDTGRPTRLVLVETSGNNQRLELSAFRDDPPADPAWFSAP